MENKVVNIQINTNIDKSVTDINKFKTGLKESTTAASGLAQKVNETGAAGDVFGQLKAGAMQLIPGLKGAESGMSSVLVKMWQIVANPIGAAIAAIVVSIKFLYEAFQSSVEGGKELKAAFAAVSAIGTQVKDAMFGLGRALIDVATAAYKFITLDFAGASESMKKANKEATESYEQLGNAVDGTTAKIVYNLKKQQQANDKAKKLQAVVQSETNKLLVQSREILTDETASIKDKKKALEEVTKAEKASSAEKVRIAQVDLDIIKAKAKALGGEEEKKSKQAIREATIALNEAETENAMTGIKLNKQRKMLLRQEVADVKERNDAIAAANKIRTDAEKAQLKIEEDERKRIAKERLDSDMASAKSAMAILDELNKAKETPAEKENREYLEKKAILEANNLDTTLLTQSYNDKIIAINKTASDKITADEKAAVDAKIALVAAEKNAKLKAADEVANTLSAMSDLLGKETAAGKAAAVASATINTFSSAQKAYDATVGIPYVGPILAPINAGIAIAAGIKNVKSILAVKVPGGGGGGSAPMGNAAQAGTTAPQFNVVGNSGANQLAQTLGREQPPIKAYVTASDVSTGQSLNRNIITNASLG